MKPYIANFINALVLVGLASWGYFSSETPSMTALIPAFVGVALLLCTPGVRKENKVIAHIAVVLTLLILIGLVKPFMGALEREDNMAILRVSIMIFTTLIALITFIRSFIQARKNRSVSENETEGE